MALLGFLVATKKSVRIVTTLSPACPPPVPLPTHPRSATGRSPYPCLSVQTTTGRVGRRASTRR